MQTESSSSSSASADAGGSTAVAPPSANQPVSKKMRRLMMRFAPERAAESDGLTYAELDRALENVRLRFNPGDKVVGVGVSAAARSFHECCGARAGRIVPGRGAPVPGDRLRGLRRTAAAVGAPPGVRHRLDARATDAGRGRDCLRGGDVGESRRCHDAHRGSAGVPARLAPGRRTLQHREDARVRPHGGPHRQHAAGQVFGSHSRQEPHGGVASPGAGRAEHRTVGGGRTGTGRGARLQTVRRVCGGGRRGRPPAHQPSFAQPRGRPERRLHGGRDHQGAGDLAGQGEGARVALHQSAGTGTGRYAADAASGVRAGRDDGCALQGTAGGGGASARRIRQRYRVGTGHGIVGFAGYPQRSGRFRRQPVGGAGVATRGNRTAQAAAAVSETLP
eukprot:ctg_1256.g394